MDTYEAWREGDHDDLVLAAAIGIWWAERAEPRMLTAKPSPRRPQPSGGGIGAMRRK